MIELAWETLDTPIGRLLLVFEGMAPEASLAYVDFDDDHPRCRRHMERRYGDCRLDRRGTHHPAHDALARYFSGDLRALDGVGVSTGGTETQRRIWTELRTIPPGSTVSYGRLATQLGMTNAARAVGHINGLNPVPIVLPCHRVIGANGSLVGYGGGLDRKRRLLELEAGVLSLA